MAIDALLTIELSVGGRLSGGWGASSRPSYGEAGAIAVIAFEHRVARAVDPAKGITGAGWKTDVFSITKEVDRASPLLRRALGTRDVTRSFALDLWRATPSGAHERYLRLDLRSALLVSLEREMLNVAFAENRPLSQREVLTFAYESLEVTAFPSGNSSKLDWSRT